MAVILQVIYRYIYNTNKANEELLINLENKLLGVSKKLDKEYKNIFRDYYDSLKTFGYPGLNERNRKSQEKGTKLQMIFIEEPEAHLHPQMQKTFIRSILGFINDKIKKDNSPLKWNIQIVITTHSSYIISEGNYNNIRYLKNTDNSIETKDLEKLAQESEDSLKFLELYLKLNKCELFFAYKVILIEGTVERMLLPLMIKNVSDDLEVISLINEYISVVEVGGAYAYKFEDLLKFIEVKTLVITDLDSVDPQEDYSCIPPITGRDYKTSNKTLQDWIPEKISIDELMQLTEDDKINKNEKQDIRVSYQFSVESDFSYDNLCGRSFEEQFHLRCWIW